MVVLYVHLNLEAWRKPQYQKINTAGVYIQDQISSKP